MLVCKFCEKECKNDNSLRNHERLCKNNPDHQISYLEANKDTILRKNGAMKAKEEGREFIVKPETRKKISEFALSRDPEWHKINGRKISETINKKVEEGTWHESLAKHMHINYNGADLHGSWELKYAQYLDSKQIKWCRNKTSFSYWFEGKNRKYTPDFYLFDSDEYIEIKGYKTEKDDSKWSQFPKSEKLTVLMKKDLEYLLNEKLK